ncbi:MAG TPA: cytochrome c3 family protein [Blastocatellia bacterium]|nr:cytochrome c3 family protein [Blastocatellia bacterium]
MRFKLTVVALYIFLALALAVGLRHTAADSGERVDVPQDAAQRPAISLDATNGRRGLVLFHHRGHESLEIRSNFDAPYLNKEAGSMNCVVCHHRRDTADPAQPDTTDVADRKQFQNCKACHKVDEADPTQFVDREGYILNAREAYHRLCIGCHMQKQEMVARGEYKVVDRLPIKCSECHKLGQSDEEYEARSRRPEPEPDAVPYENRPWPPDYSKAPVVPTTHYDPPGYAGPSRIGTPAQQSGNFEPITDRWRIGFPGHDVEPRYAQGHIYNPYRQNILKADYPILGQHNFFLLTAESESFLNAKRIPVPSNVAAQRPDSEEFFGRGGAYFFNQNFILSMELFNGDTSFKPVDWRVHVTPVFNINYLHTQENGLVNANPARLNTRTDGYIALQEAFGEYRLGDTTKVIPFLGGGRKGDKKSPFFDTTSIRAGIQPFISDFRGFIFSDVNLGARLFGNYANNRYQYNIAYFYMLEKDTNSDLNTPHFRDQTVLIANLFRQDTHWHGYTSQFSFHYNDDRPSRHFDENDFLVRPALIGSVRPHGVKSYYLGWTGDGHMGKWNITHALYQALGHDSDNPIAGREININAQMAAVELSLDRDWLRFKGSFFFASGDKQPFDGTGRGFDSILDHQEFAGGGLSFFNSQAIPLTNTAVLLTTPGSLLPALRSSKTQGQSNFVNPGLFLYNLGAEAELTPKLRAILNANYSHFHHTEPLSELLFQPDIRKRIGFDYGVGVLYRPLLSENWIVSAGYSSLIPGSGFTDIYSSNCNGQNCGQKRKVLYSAFVKLKFVY